MASLSAEQITDLNASDSKNVKILPDDNDMEMTDIEDEEYVTTWQRWLVLGIVSLINMSVAMVWLCFSPVAYKAANYYETTLLVINTLSLVFMTIAIPCGILVIWVMDKYGLRVCILICAWLGCIGSLVRICSTIESLPQHEKLVILFFGQIIAALGSPFGLYTPAKLASSWFPESQRTIANTIAASANPVGIILTGLVSTRFQETPEYYNMRMMLITYAAPCVAGAILATIFIRSDGPERPPSLVVSEEENPKVWEGVKEAVKNKMYILLVVCLGTGLGLYSSFATLLEQVLCPWGYTDEMAGVSASVLTASGIVGAVIISTIVDKTKKFSETLKAVYFLTALGVILLSLTHDIYMGYWIIAEVALIGVFAFTIYPVGTEIAAECTYPIGIGTSTGLIQLSGQLQSVVLILVLSSIGQPMSNQQVIENNSQCNHNSTSAEDTSENDVTYDMRISVYVCAGLMTFTAVILTVFFHPTYKRMEAEKQASKEMAIRRMSRIPVLEETKTSHVNESFDEEIKNYEKELGDDCAPENHEFTHSDSKIVMSTQL